jgi:hypothetical protein
MNFVVSVGLGGVIHVVAFRHSPILLVIIDLSVRHSVAVLGLKLYAGSCELTSILNAVSDVRASISRLVPDTRFYVFLR